MPDVPTVVQAGYKDFVFATDAVLLAPSQTPEAVDEPGRSSRSSTPASKLYADRLSGAAEGGRRSWARVTKEIEMFKGIIEQAGMNCPIHQKAPIIVGHNSPRHQRRNPGKVRRRTAILWQSSIDPSLPFDSQSCCDAQQGVPSTTIRRNLQPRSEAAHEASQSPTSAALPSQCGGDPLAFALPRDLNRFLVPLTVCGY